MRCVDEVVIDQILLDNDVGHGAEDRHVRAGLRGQPQLGEIHQLNATRIDHDHLGAMLLHGGLHLQRDDRMILGGVGAGHDEDVVLEHLGRGIAHGRGTERLLQGDHAAGVAEARAMVDVVRAKQRTIHLLQQIVVFVGGLGTAVNSHGIRAIAAVDLDQPIGDEIQGLVPGGLAATPSDRKPGSRAPGSCCVGCGSAA